MYEQLIHLGWKPTNSKIANEIKAMRKHEREEALLMKKRTASEAGDRSDRERMKAARSTPHVRGRKKTVTKWIELEYRGYAIAEIEVKWMDYMNDEVRIADTEEEIRKIATI